MAEEAARKGRAVEQALAAWRRRRWLAIPAFVLPLVAGVTLVLSMPNAYESSALVLVDRQQVPEEFVRSTVTSALEVRLQTLSEEILSRSRLDSLITRFGLYPQLRDNMPREALIERMRGDVRLERINTDSKGRTGTTVAFSITYRGRDPQTVAQVTNVLASSYIEENLKTRERQATGTAEFLRVQLEDTKRRMGEQEERISEFKRRYLGELPEQTQTNLSMLSHLNEQLRTNTLNQVRLAEKKELLGLQLQTTTPEAAMVVGPSGEPVVAADPRAVRLARLRQELGDLLTRFSERYPDVKHVRAQIADLEREIAEAPAPGPNPAPDRSAGKGTVTEPLAANTFKTRIQQLIGETEAELKALKGDEGRLRAAIAAYEQRVTNAPKREQELQALSRDSVTTRELHATLTRRHEEAQLTEQMEQRQKGEQFRVLNPAVASAEPAAPQRLKLLGAVLAVSLGLAGALLVLAEQLDTSFHSLEELRAFTTSPVLASIPRLVTEGDRRRRRRRFQMAGAGVLLGAVALVAAAHLVARDNEQLVWMVTRTTSKKGV